MHQEEESKLRNRKIMTMNDWCKKNGYDGVTKQCLMSASQQDDVKLRKMAEEHLKTGIIKRIGEKNG